MSKPLALIIEDDDDLSAIYSVALRGGGFETEIIRDGKAALNRLAGTPPVIIVLDIHLPHVTGIQILKEIRADDRFKKTAVIITSANERLAEDTRGKADLVLIKPVSLEQLRDLAKRMLQRWQRDTDQPE